MPTDEELQAAVQAAIDKTKTEAAAEAEARVKAAANGRFTQDDLDRIAGEARKDGRGTAERELLKALGVPDIESAKAALASAKAAEDEKKTELQRVQDEATALRAEAEAAKAEARASRIASALDLGLRKAGINPDRAAAALRLIDPSTLTLDGTEVGGVDDAVKALKAESPEWFGPRTSPPDASASGGGAVDFHTASADERDKALARYGIKL